MPQPAQDPITTILTSLNQILLLPLTTFTQLAQSTMPAVNYSTSLTYEQPQRKQEPTRKTTIIGGRSQTGEKLPIATTFL